MSITLPAPDRRLLARAGLQLVVCQVRFDEQPDLIGRKAARRIYEALGGGAGPFPNFTQLRGERVTIAPTALPTEFMQRDTVRGWRFSSVNEGEWILSVLPDSLALETTRFPGWEEMGPQFRTVLTKVNEVIGPAVEERLGLRFVNVLQIPGTTTLDSWRNYLKPEAFGLGIHEVLGQGVVAAQQQVLLQITDDVKCTVRLGPIRQDNGDLTFLVDLDGFRDLARPFDVESIANAADVLNATCVSLFQQLVTPNMLELLGQGEAEEVHDDGAPSIAN